jgi:hypothetical protein
MCKLASGPMQHYLTRAIETFEEWCPFFPPFVLSSLSFSLIRLPPAHTLTSAMPHSLDDDAENGDPLLRFNYGESLCLKAAWDCMVSKQSVATHTDMTRGTIIDRGAHLPVCPRSTAELVSFSLLVSVNQASACWKRPWA